MEGEELNEAKKYQKYRIFAGTFKDELETESAKANILVLPGNVYQLEIKGDISEALTRKINEYAIQNGIQVFLR